MRSMSKRMRLRSSSEYKNEFKANKNSVTYKKYYDKLLSETIGVISRITRSEQKSPRAKRFLKRAAAKNEIVRNDHSKQFQHDWKNGVAEDKDSISLDLSEMSSSSDGTFSDSDSSATHTTATITSRTNARLRISVRRNQKHSICSEYKRSSKTTLRINSGCPTQDRASKLRHRLKRKTQQSISKFVLEVFSRLLKEHNNHEENKKNTLFKLLQRQIGAPAVSSEEKKNGASTFSKRSRPQRKTAMVKLFEGSSVKPKAVLTAVNEVKTLVEYSFSSEPSSEVQVIKKEKETLAEVKRLPPMQRWAYCPRNILTADKSHFPHFRYGNYGKNRKVMEDALFYKLCMELITIEYLEGPEFFENKYRKKKQKKGGVNMDKLSGEVLRCSSELKRTNIPKSETEWRKSLEEMNIRRMHPSKSILRALAHAFNQSKATRDIHERFKTLHKEKINLCVDNIDDPCERFVGVEMTMNSFNVTFCRRCKIYDCFNHSPKENLSVDAYKSHRKMDLKECSGAMSIQCPYDDCVIHNKTNFFSKSKPRSDHLWSAGEKNLFQALNLVFPNAFCYIASVMMTKTCRQVKDYAKLALSDTSLRKSKADKTFTRKSRQMQLKQSEKRKQWMKMFQNRVGLISQSDRSDAFQHLPYQYFPCNHSGACDMKCECVRHDTACEKFCACAPDCDKRFPGCGCRGGCDSYFCMCVKFNRECDPDLCLNCGANDFSVEVPKCNNVSIQRRLEKKILVGVSGVSGWGAYLAHGAEKGEYIKEYCGELLSDEENERRTEEYDEQRHTYLSDMSKTVHLDATYYGNKSRFINSSRTPNCEFKTLRVLADHRAGVFACQKIEPYEELFINYEHILDLHGKREEISDEAKEIIKS